MQQKRAYRMKWENGSHFTIELSVDDGEFIDLISMEENGRIGVMWPGIQKSIIDYWKSILDQIGEEMRA